MKFRLHSPTVWPNEVPFTQSDSVAITGKDTPRRYMVTAA